VIVFGRDGGDKEALISLLAVIARWGSAGRGLLAECCSLLVDVGCPAARLPSTERIVSKVLQSILQHTVENNTRLCGVYLRPM
jgi:hypothetical protein